MRVAHVITRMIVGGAQENTLWNCRDLIDVFGDQVTLFTGPSLGPEGSLLPEVKRTGVPYEIIPAMRRSVHPFRDGISLYQLLQRLRKFQPDIIHTHSAKAGILGRWAASRLHIPCVHTVHGNPFFPGQGRAGDWCIAWAERWAARRCQKIICVADTMTDVLVSHHIAPREKCLTIYSGMDVEPFLHSATHRQAMRQELGYEDQHLVVGKIARLFHHKGHDDLISVAPNIIAAQPNVRFLLVGDGTLRAHLESRIRLAGLERYFQFVGLVEPQRIPAYLSAMDVLVHLSLREGLARTLPQALLSGKPVVSYDVDGAAEVVKPKTTGFLVPPHDLNKLELALMMTLRYEDLRNQLGQAGRVLCEPMFRHEEMTLQIREVYQSLLE